MQPPKNSGLRTSQRRQRLNQQHVPQRFQQRPHLSRAERFQQFWHQLWQELWMGLIERCCDGLPHRPFALVQCC
jgi:hypothetical protein